MIDGLPTEAQAIAEEQAKAAAIERAVEDHKQYCKEIGQLLRGSGKQLAERLAVVASAQSFRYVNPDGTRQTAEQIAFNEGRRDLCIEILTDAEMYPLKPDYR